MTRPHIVIVGAGFGGLYVAKNLLPFADTKKIDITIVNKTNYFLFTPLLHEVATGGLRPTSISESLREIFAGHRVTIYQDTVQSIHLEKKTIQTEHKELSYDYLVVATGAETAYYGIPGAKEHTLSIKNLMDAITVRNQIINAFEKAALSSTDEECERLISFAVVGGGATGVEVASELVEFVQEIKNRYYSRDKKYPFKKAKVTLINTGDELLKPFHPKIRKIALEVLAEKGVDVKLNTQVASIEPGSVHFADGKTLSAETIIWAAGVSAAVPSFLEKTPSMVSGKIQTDTFLRMKDEQSVFVLGDSSLVETPAGQMPPPMLAQVAEAEADIVSRNIMRTIKSKPLTPFVYGSKGSLVSLGQWYAAGEIGPVIIHGKIAWWIWRTVYLFKFLSWKKRTRIAFEWTIDLFYPRDITKLN